MRFSWFPFLAECYRETDTLSTNQIFKRLQGVDPDIRRVRLTSMLYRHVKIGNLTRNNGGMHTVTEKGRQHFNIILEGET